MLNLARVIHQRWADDEQLSALLPASRVFTGLNVDPAVPYALVVKRQQKPEAQFNDGATVDEVTVRVEIHHDHYDAAAAIAVRLRQVFDGTGFPLADGDRVMEMRRIEEGEQQNVDGAWQINVDFRCTVLLQSGV